MNAILEINAEEGWARVQAGVVKDQLNDAVRGHGLFFAPELSPSNRATIGGMIATDASGQGSVLYGKTRDHVLELKAVLLDGTRLAFAPARHARLRRRSSAGATASARSIACWTASASTTRALIEERFPKLNRCVTGYDLVHLCDGCGNFDLNCGAVRRRGQPCLRHRSEDQSGADPDAHRAAEHPLRQLRRRAARCRQR